MAEIKWYGYVSNKAAREECRANLQLVAAAPKLAEALRTIRNAVQSAHVDGDGRNPDCAVCKALDEADEALLAAGIEA